MKLANAFLVAVLFSTAAVAGLNDTAAIDAAVQASMKAWQVPGVAVAIVQGDRVIHIKGYGVRELGKPDPVTINTLFAIASNTKAFTSTAMAILVDCGKM